MYDISIMIKENYSLFHNNTFGIDAKCSYFIEYGTIEELKDALAFAKEKGVKMLHIGRNRAYKLVGDGSIRTIRFGTTHRIPKQCVIDYVMRVTADKEKEN
jgi:UDP-N-acetylenolpyruvoylglucosamine reductase